MPTTHTHYVPRPPVDEQPLTPNTLRAAASTLIFGRRPSATRLSTAAQLPENTIQSILEFLDDEALIKHLCKVRGVGPWTAQMFLLFQLGRLDVWPTGDLAVRKGFALAFGLRKAPSARACAPS